jgi:hypothetical protein
MLFQRPEVFRFLGASPPLHTLHDTIMSNGLAAAPTPPENSTVRSGAARTWWARFSTATRHLCWSWLDANT